MRFTYKKELLPQAPDVVTPEFKPWIYNSDGV